MRVRGPRGVVGAYCVDVVKKAATRCRRGPVRALFILAGPAQGGGSEADAVRDQQRDPLKSRAPSAPGGDYRVAPS